MFGLKEKDPDEAIVINIKRAIIALQESRFDAAEQLLHLSLKFAQEMQNQEAITYIYDMLANVAFERGENDKAEKLFKEVMQRLISSGTARDDNAIVEISLKLAKIYSVKNKHDLAIEGFTFCCNTQRKKIETIGFEEIDENTVALWGMSVDWYAHYLLLQKNFKEAKKQFQKAYDISNKVNGPDHPQTLVILNDLGSVCSLMKDYNSAIKHLQLAIDIAEETQSKDLAGFYCNLATVYMEKGIFKEARSNCEKALIAAKNLKITEAEDQALECIAEVQKAGY